MTTNTAPTIDRIRAILTEAAGFLGMPYDQDADAEWSEAVHASVHTVTVAELADELAVTPASVFAIADQVAGLDGPDRVYRAGDGRGEPVEAGGAIRSPGVGLTGHAVECIRAEVAARTEAE